MPDPCGRHQLEGRAEHAQAGPQDRHEDDVPGEAMARRRTDRRVDGDQLGRQVADGFGEKHETHAFGRPPERVGLGPLVAQRDEGVGDDRVLHQMKRHGFTIHDGLFGRRCGRIACGRDQSGDASVGSKAATYGRFRYRPSQSRP